MITREQTEQMQVRHYCLSDEIKCFQTIFVIKEGDSYGVIFEVDNLLDIKAPALMPNSFQIINNIIHFFKCRGINAEFFTEGIRGGVVVTELSELDVNELLGPLVPVGEEDDFLEPAWLGPMREKIHAEMARLGLIDGGECSD